MHWLVGEEQIFCVIHSSFNKNESSSKKKKRQTDCFKCLSNFKKLNYRQAETTEQIA